MEIWLDSIDERVIADGVKRGIVEGVTTNPSILANTGNIAQTLHKLLDLQPGPIAVQVTATTAEEMIEEGKRIFDFSPRLIVKVPINRHGLIAIQEFSNQKIPVIGTGLLFSTQALLASNNEATYVAPYFSHISEVGDPFTTLKTIVELLRANGSSTKVLVASLKKADQIIYCATLGVSVVTIKPELYQALIADHPLVEGVAQKFMADWKKKHGGLSIKEALST